MPSAPSFQMPTLQQHEQFAAALQGRPMYAEVQSEGKNDIIRAQLIRPKHIRFNDYVLNRAYILFLKII